ncbi:alpha/beta hydrolase [Pedobacter antarcticus]|uniref:alpha/beta fold hydrolase n=1 Tax=Pedobacter antarcticus TaxID=34086 RepID=UPI00292EDEB2|nr:alpha/beta hydrolase [Pedobacter antarcticus]
MRPILFLLLITTTYLSLPAVAQQKTTDNATMKKRYLSAKNQFRTFEREHGNFIQTNNVNMHYLSWGDPKKPCLIWIHGSMNNGYELLNIADSLVKAGFYVIAIDYYGHGQTAIPEHEVSLYHVADDIRFLLDRLDIEKAFVGGFSRGGYVATAFYDTYPEKVEGLILEDGGSVPFSNYYHKLGTEALKQKAAEFDSTEKMPWDTAYSSEFDAYKALYEPDEKGDQFTILALLRLDSAKKWSVIYDKMMALFNMASSKQFLDLILRPSSVPLFARSIVTMDPETIFRNLNVPLLLLDPVSENDPMPFEKENQALQQKHPRWISYIVYQNTEHNIHYQHPERFTKDLIRFMKRTHPSPASQAPQ